MYRRFDSVLLLILCLAFAMSGCWKGRHEIASIEWLGNCQLSQTGTVVKVDICWPAAYHPAFLLQTEDATNIAWTQENLRMPRRDVSNLVLRLTFHNRTQAVIETRDVSNVLCYPHIYMLMPAPYLTYRPGDTCEIAVAVLKAAADTNTFSVHMNIARWPRKWWQRKREPEPVVLTRYQ